MLFKSTYNEILKIAYKPRSYIGVGGIVLIISILSIAGVGCLHHYAGTDISLMLLYAIPVLLSAWFCGRAEGLLIALGAALTWLIVNFIHIEPNESKAILTWNAFTRFGIFALIAYTVALQSRLRSALEREKLRANTDRLTGMLNKAAFRERVEEEINRARRYNHPLTLVFLDLDNFKQVNDTQGHARGDTLLQHVSQTINDTIRKTDMAGRIGGDEFTICFPETDADHARKAIEKLMNAFDIMTAQSGWQVTASIGVLTCTELCESYDVLLGKADKLMYEAKDKGKNNAVFMTVSG